MPYAIITIYINITGFVLTSQLFYESVKVWLKRVVYIFSKQF